MFWNGLLTDGATFCYSPYTLEITNNLQLWKIYIWEQAVITRSIFTNKNLQTKNLTCNQKLGQGRLILQAVFLARLKQESTTLAIQYAVQISLLGSDLLWASSLGGSQWIMGQYKDTSSKLTTKNVLQLYYILIETAWYHAQGIFKLIFKAHGKVAWQALNKCVFT